MATLLYSLLVHAVAAGFVLCCLLAGSGLMGALARRGWTDFVLEVATRVALGIVAGATIVALLGLMHVLSVMSAWVCLGVLVVAGILRMVATGGAWPRSDYRRWMKHWLQLPVSVRTVSLMSVVALIALALNILVGALAPDVQRDSLWYHLTLPGQWLLRGDVAMLPYCMPSTYTLLVEALYVLILPFGDTLFVTAFISQLHVLTLVVFLAIGWRVGGGWGLLLTAAIAPFAYASSFAYAPIPAKPDPVTIFLLGVGWWRLVRALDIESGVNNREMLLGGVICGGAVMAKLSALLLLLPLGVCFLGVLLARRQSPRRILWAVCLLAVGGLLVAAPWLIRAALYSGNPVIHVARGIFPVSDEFLPALRGYDEVPMFHPLTVNGVWMALTESMPRRLLIAAASLNILFYIVPVASAVSLASRTTSVRVTGLGFLIAYIVWAPLLYGKGEELRYFGVGALAAAPALAGFAEVITQRLRRKLLPMVALGLLFGSAGSYMRQQITFANIATVHWPFRPVVTTHDSLQWLEHTADGLRSHYYREIRRALPRDAYVLLPDSRGPFYLNRKAVWCDYFTCPMLDDWWRGMDHHEAHADLQGRGITHILTERTPIDPRIQAMADDNLIVPAAIETMPNNWTLWLVGYH